MSCDTAGAVLSIALPGNNLQGTIPDEAFFPDLVTLVTLDLRGEPWDFMFACHHCCCTIQESC
jgi:hypothetical protein